MSNKLKAAKLEDGSIGVTKSFNNFSFDHEKGVWKNEGTVERNVPAKGMEFYAASTILAHEIMS